MKTICTLVLALFAYASFSQSPVTALVNGGQWDNPYTWLPSGVPQDGDVVVIPPGFTVAVKGNVYKNETPKPDLDIQIFGILQFDASGILDLGAGSLIQLYTNTSQILTSGGAGSEYIYIGGQSKYSAKLTATITGPAYSNIGTPNAPSGFSVGVLPVNLKSFTAQAQSNHIALMWSTATEINSSHFVVEKSTNARNWISLQTVAAKGEAANYTAFDRAPASGDNFYRLKSVDKEGKTGYSPVLKVAQSRNQSVYVSPNPASDHVSVSLSTAATAPVQLQLVANNGQVAREEYFAKGSSLIRFGLQGTRPGIYTLVLHEGNAVVEAFQLLIR